MSSRAVQIFNDRPVEVTEGYLSFEGNDDDGALRILVSILKWEELQADAAHYCDGDDRRDHALGMIEAMAADMTADRSSTGQRYLLLE